MPKLILGLTGQIGSGKEAICIYLKQTYGAETFKFSMYLSRALDVMALENSRENLIRMSETIRWGFGEDALSHAMAHDASQSTAPLAVIDGIRRIEDLTDLEPLPNFKLASVEVDTRVRYNRIKDRGEKTDEASLTWEEFLANEGRSTEVTVPETMARATLRIDNSGTPEELERQLDALMKEFQISPVASAHKN